MSSAKNLNIRANLEPITGLKIDLNANRVDTATPIYNICIPVCRNWPEEILR